MYVSYKVPNLSKRCPDTISLSFFLLLLFMFSSSNFYSIFFYSSFCISLFQHFPSLFPFFFRSFPPYWLIFKPRSALLIHRLTPALIHLSFPVLCLHHTRPRVCNIKHWVNTLHVYPYLHHTTASRLLLPPPPPSWQLAIPSLLPL